MGEVTSNGGRNFDLNIFPDFDSLTMPIIDETLIALDDFMLSFDDQYFDDLSLNLDMRLANFGNGSELQAAEGTVADEEIVAEVPKASKICKDGVGLDKTSEKEGDEKGGSSSDDVRFFDCNICFDMAKDPIVTCCGHLFCWPCIYRWLHMESRIKKGCPICKEEVTVKNVTPIYGSGNDARVHEKEENSNLNIPLRPNAKHLERRGVDLNLELGQPFEVDNASQGVERTMEALTLSTSSSSRRRNDAASSLSGADSGDSPSPIRRRFNNGSIIF